MSEGLKPEILIHLVTTTMPFGKYKDRLICDIPVSYLEWLVKQKPGKGKVYDCLMTMYEIRINGLEYLLDPIKRTYAGKR